MFLDQDLIVSDLKRAKELIRIFRDKFAEEIEVPENQTGDEVYRLTIAYFPLTASQDKNKDSK